MKTCPKCSLLNPDSAVVCDCGHAFDLGAASAARAAGFRARHETHPPGPSKGAKVGFALVGYFVGALPPIFVGELRAAAGQGESQLFSGLAFFTGLGGVFIALHLLKKRHESLRAQRTSDKA